MSRNFELLEQLDRERLRDAAEYRTEEDPAAPGALEPKRETPTEEELATPGALRPNRRTRTYEELNKLVQGLFLSGLTPARQVAFTGAGAGVGCTWICVHATEVLSSQTTGNVCLVDANTSSPGVAEYFKIPDGAGFFDALAEDAPLHSFTRKAASNVWVIAAGGNPKDGTVFPPERVGARLFELGREFDFVLFDAAPVATSAVGLTVATLASGAVLVLKAGHTSRRTVWLALKKLEIAHAKVLGTVLNQRDYPIPEAIYQRL